MFSKIIESIPNYSLKFSVERVCEDMFYEIFSFLDVNDLLNVSLVNKYFEKVSSYDAIWKVILKRTYPKKYRTSFTALNYFTGDLGCKQKFLDEKREEYEYKYQKRQEQTAEQKRRTTKFFKAPFINICFGGRNCFSRNWVIQPFQALREILDCLTFWICGGEAYDTSFLFFSAFGEYFSDCLSMFKNLCLCQGKDCYVTCFSIFKDIFEARCTKDYVEICCCGFTFYGVSKIWKNLFCVSNIENCLKETNDVSTDFFEDVKENCCCCCKNENVICLEIFKPIKKQTEITCYQKYNYIILLLLISIMSVVFVSCCIVVFSYIFFLNRIESSEIPLIFILVSHITIIILFLWYYYIYIKKLKLVNESFCAPATALICLFGFITTVLLYVFCIFSFMERYYSGVKFFFVYISVVIAFNFFISVLYYDTQIGSSVCYSLIIQLVNSINCLMFFSMFIMIAVFFNAETITIIPIPIAITSIVFFICCCWVYILPCLGKFCVSDTV